MGMSLDGFVAGPDGDFDWSEPDDELHGFHNDHVRGLAAHVLGRRLYETMVYWETADRDPSASEVHLDFAAVWKALPKVVFSSTLESVEGNTRLVRGDVVEEVTRLKAETDGDIAVGGPTLAAALIEHDLVDEYLTFTYPVIVGAGTPYLPPLPRLLALEAVDRREFAGGVTHVRYRRAR